MRQRNERGFTLIELLMVIAIIGLIATIVTVGLQNVQTKRRDVSRVSNMQVLQKALSLYLAQTSAYPTFDGCLTGTDAVSTELAAKGLIITGAKLVDPLWTTPLDAAKCYYYKGGGAQYTLRYTLEADSAAGTAGDHLILP